MIFAGITDKGRTRINNEDNFRVILNGQNQPVAYVIADGMGGYNSGEIASSMAVDLAQKLLPGLLTDEGSELDNADKLKKAAETINTGIYEKSKTDESLRGMGTTLDILIPCGQKAYIIHIGDSRVYRFRKGKLMKITNDHSYVNELLSKGMISDKEAEQHPDRHMLTKAVGCFPEADADIYITDKEENDIFLMCTDGIYNMLSDEEIEIVLSGFGTPEDICNRLILMANEKGGFDNITILTVCF